jgi:hypothetical protein
MLVPAPTVNEAADRARSRDHSGDARLLRAMGVTEEETCHDEERAGRADDLLGIPRCRGTQRDQARVPPGRGARDGEHIELASVGATLAVDEIYASPLEPS